MYVTVLYFQYNIGNQADCALVPPYGDINLDHAIILCNEFGTFTFK